MNFRAFSYRFAEEVLNSRLPVKQEIEEIIRNINLPGGELTRPNLNEAFREKFLSLHWQCNPPVFEEGGAPRLMLDFLRERVGVEVAFSHHSFLGIDLLKFQVMSFSNLNRIDVGVYIVTTRDFQKRVKAEFDRTWEGSLTFEQVVQYLPHLRTAIHVPIFVYGLELPHRVSANKT